MRNTHEPKNKLGQLIIDRGYTIQGIGGKIGYKGLNSFSEVINGTKSMPVRKWVKLSEILEKTVNELIKLYDEQI